MDERDLWLKIEKKTQKEKRKKEGYVCFCEYVWRGGHIEDLKECEMVGQKKTQTVNGVI